MSTESDPRYARWARDAARVAAVAAAFMLTCAASTFAQTIIDGEGFEPTQYSTTFGGDGKLEGQLGDLPGDGVQAAWLASIGTTSTAVVQSSVVNSGTQAIQMDHAANEATGGGRFGIPVTAWPDNARYVCIEWDMYVEETVGPTGTFGPFFGVEAYDDITVGQGDFGLLGSLGVDASTGDVLYQQAGTGFLVETGLQVNFGEWNHFHIDLDFELGEYSIFVNTPADPNLALATEPFVDGGASLQDFSDAPLASFAAAGDPQSQALTGTAYFDNYIVYQLDVKIPEPTTMAMCMLALVATCSTSRRRG
ncbi:MAG: hypothetical protein AAGD11_00600 [Planctomycetota bacterium]